MTRYWDELGDRDPLVTDLLEVEGKLPAEEAAMHLIGMPAYDAVDLEDVMEELAIEEGTADELLEETREA
jgi:hypothetical protein